MSYEKYPSYKPPFHRTILTGDFVRCLKKSNPGIQCFGLMDSDNPASIFYHDEQICALPKGSLPPLTVRNLDGSIKYRSWWEVLKILGGKRLVVVDEVIKAIRKL